MSTVRWDAQLYLPRRSATVVVYDGVKTGRLLTSVTSLERNDVTRRRHTQAGGRVESRSKLTHLIKSAVRTTPIPHYDLWNHSVLANETLGCAGQYSIINIQCSIVLRLLYRFESSTGTYRDVWTCQNRFFRQLTKFNVNTRTSSRITSWVHR